MAGLLRRGPPLADALTPQVPDGLTEHALLRCGFAEPDQRLCVRRLLRRWRLTLTLSPSPNRVRLVSLAAQQLVADVAVDAHACVLVRPCPTRPSPDLTRALLWLAFSSSVQCGLSAATQRQETRRQGVHPVSLLSACAPAQSLVL